MNSAGSRFYLILLSFVAALGGFLFGFDTAVISGTVTLVREQFAMSTMTEGWFVSSALLGCIVGVAFAGKVSDSFGRKKVMLVSGLLFLISGIGCAWAGSQNGLIFYRWLGGIGVGVASIVSPLYLSEFAPAHLRGRMVAVYQLAITLGILLAYFSNVWLLGLSQSFAFSADWLHYLINEQVWRAMLGMNAAPAVLFLILLFFVPESPRWLIIRKKTDQARLVLQKINGTEVAADEIKAIESVVQQESGQFKLLFNPVYRLALFIGLTLPLLSQFSGINAVIYYGPRILEQAGFALSDALGGQVTIGIVNFIFTFVAILTVDSWGRRPLLMFGVVGAVLALMSAGLLFFLNWTTGPWILSAIVIYIACFAFSFGPICWIIVGEIYPTSIRGRAMSLATMTIWIGNFFVGQLTPWLLENIGPAGTFWLFAVLCSPAFFITWKLVPETKGKSLEQIETYWAAQKQ